MVDLSAVIVTSPTTFHPATSMLEHVVGSLRYVKESISRIIIVFDWFRDLREAAKAKRGVITEDMRQGYMAYIAAVTELYGNNPRFILKICESHQGFAWCVHIGLLECATKYAIICQHDRAFTSTVDSVSDVIDICEANEYIRYVGFPTVSNINNNHIFVTRYPKLRGFQSKNVPIKDGLVLQPLIFWYDSNHLCHIQRYLEIYKPFVNIPSEYKQLMKEVGIVVHDFLCRNGDFIEDRFGQAQRNFLVALSENDHDFEFIFNVFKWFGSYLLCDTRGNLSEEGDAREGESLDSNISPPESVFSEEMVCTPRVMVRHFHGRNFSIARAKEWQRLNGVDEPLKGKYFVLESGCGGFEDGEEECD